MRVDTIVSGGQTGVDQAALRAARALGLQVEGWCPPDRVCETGTIAIDWPLVETPRDRSRLAPQVARSLRTEWNVRDSDATLLLRRPGLADPGSDFTLEAALHYGRHSLEIDPWLPEAEERVAKWLLRVAPRRLHVAGSSESTDPGIGERVFRLLLRVFDFRD